MRRWVPVSRGAAVLLSFALSWALSLSAFAVNLTTGEARVNDGPSAVDTASYRSSSGRHKVLIERGNADSAKSVQATRSHNYGSFQVLEVNKATADRLIAAGIGSNADGHNLILFNTGAVDTTSPDVVANRSRALNMNAGKQLHLIQFPGPIKPEWYAQLEATGVEIVTPIPSNAYLVYGDPVALDNVAALADNSLAQWQGPYLSRYKLQPGVATDAKTIAANSAKSLVPGAQGSAKDNLYQVQLIRDPSTNAATEAFFSALPALSRYEIKSYVNLVVTISPELLEQVAKRPDVISIAKYIEPRLMDERQAMIVAGELTGNLPNPGNYFTKLSTWGLTQAQFNTSGIVVDVTDDGADRNPTGADPGTVPTNSNSGPVLARHFVLYEGGVKTPTTVGSRFVYKGVWGTLGTDAGLGKSGHGQLNMSIIGGFVPDSFDTGNTQVHRDAQGFRYGLGIAPFVKLGNSVIFDPGYTNPIFPNLLSSAYSSGARISSNSWGAPVAGAYNVNSQAYDILVRDSQSGTGGNQPMLAVFAAGNDGAGAQTVGSPGTGKNVLTVGAGENVHSHALAAGGAGTGADSCDIDDTGANSANDIIGFSSRGPTADGRKKPDIVAPGTHVTGMSFVAVGQNPTSPVNGLGAADAAFRADGVCGMPGGGTAGSLNNFFPLIPAQKWYTTSSGTSHSTPAVAGSAALIYQQFLNNPNYIGANRTPPGPAAPSPALVKAYLTNSARYMTGISANDTLPSNNQGMGSVNLGTAFDGVQRIIRDQDATDRFTASGQVRTYFATVASATAPLRVTLAYTDKEGPTSGNAFVNNLDLTVSVGASTYKGNVFSGANSVTGGVADTRNNLESVFLPAGFAVGTTVLIQVKAFNIPGIADPTVAGVNQDFALVVYNAISAPPQAFLSVSGTALPTGNGVIEPNECNDLNISLTNVGNLGATAVGATLATSTSGVTIAQGRSTYSDIAASGTAANLTSFKVNTASSVACGSVINLTQTVNFTGGASPISFPLSLPVGAPANTVLFSQSFDGVSAPTLPPFWTTAQTGATPPALWATTATGSDIAPNAAFTNGSTTVATSSLISPAIALPASPFAATLSFRHAWNFEGTTTQFDGGILELSTDNGLTFNNVTSPAIGATFTAGGYTGVIAASDGNPIGGQSGWGKAQATFVTSTLTLPASLNGQTIKLRWRAGWDNAISAANPNWRIDTILLVGGVTCTTGPGVCVVTLPPNLSYSPTTATTVAFTGVTTVGSAGNGSIAVTPSAGSGAGASATSTVNGCAFSGANAANFAVASAVSLSFVGSTTTAQNIAMTCTSGSTARSATLTCNETLGSGAATQRAWPLSCPVGSAPPQFGYLPTTSSTVAATGGALVGSSGALSIVPSVATSGSGSGAAATTTLTCTPPTSPFSGFAQSVTATGSGAITGGPLAGTCTLGATAQTQTLSCSENRGGTATPVTWTLSCPVGNAAPQFGYAPTSGSSVAAAVGPLGGSGALTITPSVATAGSGSGAAAITTLTCTAPTAPFSGFGQSITATGNGAISGGSLAGSCTLAAIAQTQTLSCAENRGGTSVPVSWTLSCPVGCSLDVNGDGAVTADKDSVLLSRYLLGFRGAGLIADVPLGAGRANAAAVETFIGTAAQFDVFGRPVPVATATQDSLVLIRLMLSVPDTALLGGITLPSGALFTSGSAVRANVNARCGTAY